MEPSATRETQVPAEESPAAAAAERLDAAIATAPIDEPYRSAWAALIRSHAAITERIQSALTENGLPPLQWYELLATVDAAPEGYLKLGEVAEALIISRGGLTKLFDRLETAGLVSRRSCPTDRRASNAVIEPAGQKLLAEMRPIVARELEAAFAGRLSAEEATTIAEALERARGSACSGE